MKSIEEIEDPEVKGRMEALLHRVKDHTKPLNEAALTREDSITLIKGVYEKLRDYIQASVLLSFLEQRRQIKALQRELADHRKQTDKETKLNAQFRQETSTKLNQIHTMLVQMQVPVERDGGDYRTQRRQFYRKQKYAYDMIDKIAKRLNVK